MNDKFYLAAFTLFILSCKNTSDPGESLPSLFEPPLSISLDTSIEYTVNPFTGDSIPVLNYSSGEFVPTGIPIDIKGMPVSTDTMAPPQIVIPDPPTDIPLHSNVSVFTDIAPTKNFDERKLRRYAPGKDKTDVVLINMYGDTIPLERPVQISERKHTLIHPLANLTRPPKVRDNSLFDIQYLDTDNGLNNIHIHSIIQDNTGAIWFGTQKGLSWYDGSSIRNYEGDMEIDIAFVKSMLVDSKGNHWISSASGIYCINDTTFTSIREQDKLLYINGVNTILEDNEGNVWFGLWNGVVARYKQNDNSASGILTHFILNANPSPGLVSSIIQDSEGNLWFGTTRDGLFKYNGKEFIQITVDDGLPGNGILSLCNDQNNQIWMGTSKGACLLKTSKNGEESTLTYFTTKEGLSNDMVRSIIQDKSGNVWLGTWGGGVNKLTLTDYGRTAHLQHYTETEGLSNNFLLSLFQDKDGNIWTGTSGGGLNIIKHGSFEHLTEINFPVKIIRCVYEDSRNNIWIGTEGLGIYMVPFKNGKQLQAIKKISTSKGYVIRWTSVALEDSKGNLWLGSTEGVLKAFPSSDNNFTFEYYTADQGFTNAWPTCMMEDSKGNIWMGTYGAGLIQWRNSVSGYKLIHYTEDLGFSCNYVTGLAEDNEGNLWVATDMNGLAMLNLTADGLKGTMTVYSEKEGMPGNNLYSLAIDENDHLWIGTEGAGICHFQPPQNGQKGVFTGYSKFQGLSDGFVRGIFLEPIKNDTKRIWVTTMNGLNLIQYQDTGNVMIQSFGQYEGLKRTDFSNCEILLDHQNHLWFGTGKGLEKLPLDEFGLSPNIPIPYLRQLEVNENPVSQLNPEDQSKHGIWFEHYSSHENYPISPELNYRNKHLTFYFSAVDWQAPQKIKYSYFIDGVDDKWSIPSGDTKAEYRNLPFGTHTFKVRAIGESQKWSEPFIYTFTIRPPWWYSWWAFAMYGFFGGFILYRTHRFQVNRKLEFAERQRLVELDKVKNRLYTNITHEFRTPLTLIHGPVSQALSQNATLDQKDIQSIYKQSERLQQLINQMLELQKLEAGMLKPNYTYGEIIQTLRYLFGSFETWAEEKKISMIFSSSLQEVYMDFDKEKLTQIISNLVSNAIKHTPRNGKVAMVIGTSSSGEFLLINITDTGVGIGEEDLPFVFDRFYQTKKAASGGTGIGLALVKNLTELLGGRISVESKIDIGSTVKLMLPITKQAPILIEPVAKFENMFDDAEDEGAYDKKTTGKPIALIVEDHPDVLKYLVSCLSQEYATVTAMNGDEGLRLAHEHIPDIIISDVMMPGKDGFELCTILKTDIKTSHIPIILLTGKGDHEAMLSGIEHGADAYVLKPFDPAELILRTRKLLELRNTLSHYYRQHASAATFENVTVSSAKENEFLKRARNFVEDHLNDSQFNMNMLCHHLAMSHPQLHRKITALTGESAGKFVRSIRLAKAVELLKNSDLTVSEIAYETGFSEPGYFTKVFSREFNQSPTEFRSSHQH